MEFSQQNIFLPKLGMKYKPKISDNLVMVIKVCSKNPLKKYYFNNMVKGYLHYKTITFQNVPSKAQIKNFFIS